MGIHPTAIVDSSAKIDPTATIGPHVVIDGPVEIGARTTVQASAVILGRARIGADCRIHSHSVVGDVPQDRAYQNDDSLCLIGDRCTIREGVTIHRGTGDGTATVIGNDCFLMTNSHVGHNCTLADHVTMVSGSLLGGHVQVGEKAVISGNTAVHQFVRVGMLTMLAGVTAVTQDIPPFAMTDHLGRVAGINVVGLRRSGYGSAERAEIKHAFRLLYRQTLPLPRLVELLSDGNDTDVLNPLIEFLMNSNGRGLCKGTTRVRSAA